MVLFIMVVVRQLLNAVEACIRLAFIHIFSFGRVFLEHFGNGHGPYRLEILYIINCYWVQCDGFIGFILLFDGAEKVCNIN